jgi:hypothetical protein
MVTSGGSDRVSPTPTAVAVDGGFRLTGRESFCTQAPVATVIATSAALGEPGPDAEVLHAGGRGGAPRRGPGRLRRGCGRWPGRPRSRRRRSGSSVGCRRGCGWRGRTLLGAVEETGEHFGPDHGVLATPMIPERHAVLEAAAVTDLALQWSAARRSPAGRRWSAPTATCGAGPSTR